MRRKKNWNDYIDNLKDEMEQKDWRIARDINVAEKIKKETAQEIKKSVVVIKAKTPNQQTYINCIKECTLTICSGVAGTGKTYIACGVAARYLNEGKIERIILTRPLVECGRKLGALPGSLSEKTDAYMSAMFEAFGDFFEPNILKKHFESKTIEVVPLETMRGRTFHNAFMILDEAQNATKTQMTMFLTRMGVGTKVIVCGDTKQSDLDQKEGNPLPWVIERLSDPDIAKVAMGKEDIQRHGLLRHILERLSD